MHDVANVLILLGGLFLISLVISPVSARLGVPRVTLLIASGVVIGPQGLALINGGERDWFPIISHITLLIIGYLLGARLTRHYLARYARGVLVSSLLITLTTTVVVALGLLALGFDATVAWVLGAIAAATDPAATLDVLKQRRNRGHFGLILEGVVAMDDVLGLLIFSVVLTGLTLFEGGGGVAPLLHLIRDVGGALVLGVAMGGMAAYLLDRKPTGQPVIVDSLAFIFLCGGLAQWLEVSFLLAAMTMGMVVVNRADTTYEHLHEIEFIEQPFLVLFFIMAGATLNLDQLGWLGLAGLAYVLLRVGGRVLGGWLVPVRYIEARQRPWLGLALLPQAGVALGMALVAADQFPEHADLLVTIAIAATIFFEMVGPVLTHLALNRVEHGR